MKISKKMKLKLFALLIVLNFILRIPSYPHEQGHDSFVIHILANSVSTFGRAEWWINPLSIVGMYPFSECSAVPFLLSAISHTTGVDVERSILLLCILLGLFTIFGAYILAGLIVDDDLFKFLVAFGFSISPAILNYLTWTITMRGPLIALLPLFTYVLLKSHTYKLRCGLIAVILFTLLFATHHLAYFLIPVCIGYFVVAISYKLKSYIKSAKFPENFTTIVLIIGFFVMLAIPFITRHFIEGSRYEAVNTLFLSNFPRYVGPMYVLAIGGFTYLLFKSDKKFGEWSLLLILLFLTPFLFAQTYMKWFIPYLVILLACVGLINITKLNGQKKRYILPGIVIFLLLSVSFSGFYQHWRTGGTGVQLFGNYMKESTYTTGLWVKENIDGTTISNDVALGIRVFSISDVPLATGYYNTVDLSYGFVNVSGLKLAKKPITTEAYWFSGPYSIISGGYSSKSCWNDIMGNSYEYYKSRYRHRFNFTHVIEKRGSYSGPFLQYIHEMKYCVYDCGKVRVWNLK